MAVSACGSGATAPKPLPGRSGDSAVVVIPAPPLPAGPPAAIYERESAQQVPGSSRYVFYSGNLFVLQYAQVEFPGKYSRNGNILALQFSYGPWQAQGSLAGAELVVKYNDVMVGSDFEDGTYRSSQPLP